MKRKALRVEPISGYLERYRKGSRAYNATSIACPAKVASRPSSGVAADEEPK
ncbi:MAG TPA: hypothetical protein VFW28_10370 [Micropepsaceae bacterium]|nr:hypothetical protein [Micropepsaceae bacterium]